MSNLPTPLGTQNNLRSDILRALDEAERGTISQSDAILALMNAREWQLEAEAKHDDAVAQYTIEKQGAAISKLRERIEFLIKQESETQLVLQRANMVIKRMRELALLTHGVPEMPLIDENKSV